MSNENYLIHHGTLGMKWGIRRYQNEDGSRTAEGLEHLRETRQDQSLSNKLDQKSRSSSLDPETAAMLKSTAKVLGTAALTYAARRYLGPQVQRQLMSAGRTVATRALHELPNAPMHAISGAKTLTSVGMKATQAGMRGGVGLIKVGGAITKFGWKVATAGFR